MHIKITCMTHNDCPVIPAGDTLHWIPTNSIPAGDAGVRFSNEFDLDYADLYCTGGEGAHNFLVTITQGDVTIGHAGDHVAIGVTGDSK